MRYTIYKVTNLQNGKYYIGKHQTLVPDDCYYGSGKAIKAAIKQYGKHNFTKTILFDFDNEAEMNDMERTLITEEIVHSDETYNMAVGGEGGPHFKGKSHTPATKRVLAEIATGRVPSEDTVEKYRKRTHSEETKRKIAEKARLRRLSPESKARISASVSSYANANPMTETTKLKISETMKKYRAKLQKDIDE